MSAKTVLILGANSDVAKQALLQYHHQGHFVIAASRNTKALAEFVRVHALEQVEVCYFDAVNYQAHAAFYAGLSRKPHIVLYAAGFLRQNPDTFRDFSDALRMMQVNYAGAVSILNIVAMDKGNSGLKRIVGISSMSGVRGRKSNFVYGSTKAAFTTYLAGLRQLLAPRKVCVNVVISGYIRTKINAGLELNERLMLEPEYVAGRIVRAGRRFRIVPGFKWKLIHRILKVLPEGMVARLP